MDILITIIVCTIAGIGAGLGAGFAGISTAVAITPLLVTFLGMDVYEAVGIALASDVPASAVSAWIYYKNKNIDFRDGFALLASVLVFTMIGSYVATWFSATTMTGLSVFMSLFLGFKFLLFPVTTTKDAMMTLDKKRQVILALICGVFIGFICGFMGAGGGVMMLLALTIVMGSELKTAVGTSVFVMTFTAFTGAATHFYIGATPDFLALGVCMVSTLIFAQLASKIANRVAASKLNRIAGFNLVIISGVVLLVQGYRFLVA